MSNAVPTVSSRIGRLVLRVAAENDTERQDVLRRCQIEPSVFDDPDSTLPLPQIGALWQIAASRHPVALGLEVARRAETGELGVLEHLVVAHQTVGEALASFVQYQSLLQQSAGRWALALDGGEAHLTLDFLGPKSPVHEWVVELGFAGLLRVIGQGVVGGLTPRRVNLVARAPSTPDAHELGFGTLPHYEASQNKMSFDERDMSLSLQGDNPALRHLLESLVEKSVPQETRRLVDQVTETLARNLAQCDASTVALRLGLSERSLRRHLKAAGTSFSTLLEEVRKQRAQEYLADPLLSTKEIAYLLGFAQVSSFNKAYRRWYGKAPRRQ